VADNKTSEPKAEAAGLLARALAPESMLIVGRTTVHGSEAHYTADSVRRRGGSRVTSLDIDSVDVSDADAVRVALDGRVADLALLCDLSPGETIDAAAALAESGLPACAIIHGGFDALDSGGVAFAERLLRRLAPYGMRVIGPNAFGPMNHGTGLVTRPTHAAGSSGVAVLTQSGNILLDAMLALAEETGRGPSVGWAIGNMVDVTLAEAVSAVASLDDVRVIAVHCEGARGGRRLFRALQDAAVAIPVVLLMGATSEAGQRSAVSHTGSMGVPRVIMSGAASKAGVHVVERTDDFMPLADALARAPRCSGNRVAIIADGGGHATLAADRLTEAGFVLARLTAETAQDLEMVAGHAIGESEPLDIGGRSRPDAAFAAAAVLARADEVDLVFLAGAMGAYALNYDDATLERVDIESVRALTRQLGAGRPPVVAALFHSGLQPPSHQILRDAGVVVSRSIDHAAAAAAALLERSRFLADATTTDPYVELATCVMSGARPLPLDEPSARARLAQEGLSAAHHEVVTDAAGAKAAVARFDTACAFKIVSPQIIHKSEVGGVALDVGQNDAGDRFDDLVRRVSLAVSEATIEGVLVTPMAPRGVEVIVGAHRDPDLGPCVAVGTGGYYAELLQDVVFRPAPVSTAEASRMLESTKAHVLLHGYRGERPGDVRAVAALISQLSRIIVKSHDLREIDLNPVIVTDDGLHLVDVRVVVDALE